VSWIPGWDSVAGANAGSNFFFWASIGALILLGVSEVVSHRYGERKDYLAAQEQGAAQRQHDEEIARLNLETADANKATEELRRENLGIRSRIAGRRIAPKQHDILVSELSRNPGIFNIQSMSDGESALYAADIFRTLTDAHWTVDKKEFPLGEVWHGLIIFQTDDPAALRIAEALKAADIPFLIGDDQHKKDRATILVGAKPPPF
jgi:hypothetical protein